MAEAAVGQVRVFRSSRVHPEDGSIVEEEFEYGTGVRLAEEMVVTARHTLLLDEEVGSRIEFWHAGNRYFKPCRPLMLEEERDVAVLHCPGSRPGSLDLSPGAGPRIGAYVYVAGYPSYRFKKPRMILSRGQVLSRSYSLPGAGVLPERRNLLLIDAPAYAGQSGAALFDKQLRLLGVVTKANQTGKGNWDGRTFAVAAREIETLLARARRELSFDDDYSFLEDE